MKLHSRYLHDSTAMTSSDTVFLSTIKS